MSAGTEIRGISPRREASILAASGMSAHLMEVVLPISLQAACPAELRSAPASPAVIRPSASLHCEGCNLLVELTHAERLDAAIRQVHLQRAALASHPLPLRSPDRPKRSDPGETSHWGSPACAGRLQNC